jgi:hypothetical protein
MNMSGVVGVGADNLTRRVDAECEEVVDAGEREINRTEDARIESSA